ncbi:MAG: FAD-dependent oxidoreductase [Herbinix sp.]|jgi:hypothetical protein|nr:FAD-dependent oxidoreductase [Herbinix sp.]
MKIQFQKEIPLNNSFDIIVAGGGPAGCSAAIAAARGGARVLLVEASGALGGMGTIGLVPAWCPFSDKLNVIYRGIALEVFDKMKACMKHVKNDHVDWVPIDPEVLKRVYDELVSDAGVTVLFHTQVISATCEDNAISYLVASNKSGLTALEGKIFIDCTGDADIVAMADLPFAFGDGNSKDLQPDTHCFTLSNVDEYNYMNAPVLLHMKNPDCAAYDIARSDQYPLVTDAHCCHSLIGPRTVGFNAGHLWNIDPLDPFSVSEAMMKGRQLAYQYHQGLKEFLPEIFGASFLTATASAMGIRESRRIVGEYTITVEDYLSRRSFPDEIGRNSYFLDVHISQKERDKVMTGESDGEEGFKRYAPGESHGIPYRCLIPKGFKNLLVAGKTISSDRQIQGSVRVMPVCLVTGQAAGTAAVLALRIGDVKNVEVEELRNILRENGAYFE